MVKRIAAIVLIFFCTSLAWLVLGTSVWSRTNDSSIRLTPNMASIWGTPQVQEQPFASYEDGTQVVALTAESSRVNAEISLDYRQKGLLWYSVYVVNFDGVYVFRNSTAAEQTVLFQLDFPSKEAIYDGLSLQINGHPQVFQAAKGSASVKMAVAAGERAMFRATYKSQGMESWRYKLGNDITQTRDFLLTLKTNFKQIDFPLSTLAPTGKRPTQDGWELTWRFSNLISGFQIGMTMPEKVQPGPLAGQISYFAPVSLLLYFFVIFILTTIKDIHLHPMNYFFLAASFFAFHLLLAYSVDHISIQLGFLLSSAVSVGLAASYLRIVVGSRFALVEAGLAQFVYLVLFSYTFFLRGFTGLSVTVGCIITLFVAMQLTARTRWNELFKGLPLQPAAVKI